MSGRFASLVRGELLKISHQPANWPLPLVPLAAVTMLAVLSGGGGREAGGADGVAQTLLDPLTLALQVGVGIPLLMISARATGQEYQLGTVRVLVARGTGRVRLLLAKLAACSIVGAAGFVATAVLGMAFLSLAEPGAAGALAPPSPLLWRDASLNLLAIAFSLAACLALGTFVSALSRSVVFGLSVALAWLPFENLAALMLPALAAITHQDGYARLTGYLLSTNLNVMVHALEPWRGSVVFFARPVVPVDGPHAVLVVGGYLAAFAGASLLLTWRRDVRH